MEKKLALIPTVLIILFLTYACPEKDIEPDSTITIVNNSSDSLLWWIALRQYHDTLLPSNNLFPTPGTRGNFLIYPDSNVIIKEAFIHLLQNQRDDLLMLFLFGLRDVEKNHWDTIRINYLMRRRYDLTIDELNNLGWTITYP